VRLLLVSGGFSFFTARLEQRLGLDYTISNELELKEGRLTGGLVGRIVDAAAKAARFREAAQALGVAEADVLAVLESGELKGKKIGVVASDGNPQALKTVTSVLIPRLKQLGYKVADNDNIVLPCASSPTTCSQQDVAVQRLKNDGVSFVFNAADVLAGETLVAEAEKAGYKPTWSTNRNNTTDTVAKFFKPVADAWEGANGVSVTWPDTDFSQETKDCNTNAAKGGIFKYTPDQNAYAAYGQYCIMMNLIAQGLKDAKGSLTPSSFLAAMLAIGTIPRLRSASHCL